MAEETRVTRGDNTFDKRTNKLSQIKICTDIFLYLRQILGKLSHHKRIYKSILNKIKMLTWYRLITMISLYRKWLIVHSLLNFVTSSDVGLIGTIRVHLKNRIWQGCWKTDYRFCYSNFFFRYPDPSTRLNNSLILPD